jgi:hypothetical protein
MFLNLKCGNKHDEIVSIMCLVFNFLFVPFFVLNHQLYKSLIFCNQVIFFGIYMHKG